MKTFTSISLTLALTLLTACAATDPGRRLPASAGELTKITAAEFAQFPRIGGFTLLKFVIYLKNGKPDRVAVIDPRTHAFHYQFLGASLNESREGSFKKAGRKYYLGSLLAGMHFGEGQWDFRTPFQLTTEEALAPAEAKLVANQLSAWLESHVSKDDDWSFSFSTNTAYKPLEEHRAEVSANLAEYEKAGVNVKMSLSGGEVRAYAFGWGAGRLVAVATEAEFKAALAKGTIDQNTLLLTNTDILDLPPVAGIISARPITEASHMTLLAQMYGIPLVYQKGGFERFRSMEGQWAFLETKSGADDSYQFVGPLSEAQVPAIQKLRPAQNVRPQVDWSTTAILPVNKITANQVKAYGGKASKFGLLQRTIPANTRDLALGIPVAYYQRFLAESKTAAGENLRQAASTALGTLDANPSYAETFAKAAQVRELMKKAVVPPALINEIREELRKHYPGTGEVRLKIRSSSNVEDGAEFNGAGLYESEGVCLSNCVKKDDFASGLVKVWSSLYTGRGLWARKRFGVPEEKVGMGLLAHRPYKGETANGVALLRFEKDYEDKAQPACHVLGVAGEDESITNSTEGGGNERVIVRRGEISEVRPARGQPDGRTLMAPHRYLEVCALMEKLHGSWPEKLDLAAIESEWKLTPESGEERLHLKQVRQVPSPALYALPKDRVTTILPTAWGFRGEWAQPVSSGEYKLDLLSFRLGNPSYEDLTRGNVQVTEAFAHQRGKKIPLQAGAARVKAAKNYEGKFSHYELNVPLHAPGQPDRTLTFAISKKNKGELLLAPELSVDVTYSKLYPAYSNDSSLIADQKAMKNAMHEAEKECPVRISWNSRQRWVGGDDEFRTLENVKITGLLKRPIQIASIPWAAYHRKLHETIESEYIDLFLDTSLSSAERKQLEGMGGRYLDHAIEHGRFHLAAKIGAEGKKVKGCTTYENGPGDEGAE